MELETLILIFLLVSVSAYLLMQSQLIDIIYGFALLSNGINLMILFTSDNPDGKAAPIILGPAQTSFADPLPQALILTAIVIGFGLTAVMIVLAFRVFGQCGSTQINSYKEIDLDD